MQLRRIYPILYKRARRRFKPFKNGERLPYYPRNYVEISPTFRANFGTPAVDLAGLLRLARSGGYEEAERALLITVREVIYAYIKKELYYSLNRRYNPTVPQ